MDEQIKEQLIKSIDNVQIWVEQGANFAAEQTPLIIEEIVWKGLVVESYHILFALCFFITSVVLGRIGWKWAGNLEPGWNEQDCTTARSMIIIAVFCMSLPFFDQLIDPFIIWAAPRIYVIEQLARLM